MCVVFLSAWIDGQVDLKNRTVRTLAGNGTKAESDYVGGQRGSAQLLNSPWDLAFDRQVTSVEHNGFVSKRAV